MRRKKQKQKAGKITTRWEKASPNRKKNKAPPTSAVVGKDIKSIDVARISNGHKVQGPLSSQKKGAKERNDQDTEQKRKGKAGTRRDKR